MNPAVIITIIFLVGTLAYTIFELIQERNKNKEIQKLHRENIERILNVQNELRRTAEEKAKKHN